MNSTTRLLAIASVNIIIVSLMLYRLTYSGVDVGHTRLIDNANDLSFMFDFVSYLAALFFINTVILAYPSSKSSSLKRVIGMLELRKIPAHPLKRSRKHPA